MARQARTRDWPPPQWHSWPGPGVQAARWSTPRSPKGHSMRRSPPFVSWVSPKRDAEPGVLPGNRQNLERAAHAGDHAVAVAALEGLATADGHRSGDADPRVR